MLIKDTAICIRALDYSETSQIVTFFTKDNGKIAAIAKGSKRLKSSFGGPIEIFSFGKIIFTDSNKEKLATLTEFEADYDQPVFSHIGDSFTILNYCYFTAELLDNLTDDYDPHPELFESFIQFLKDAGNKENNQRLSALLILFQLILLREAGLQPILNHCVNCKTQNTLHSTHDPIRETKYEMYFSSSANGLICKDCEISFPDKIRLSRDAANCLIDLKILTQANDETLKEIEKILIRHFTNLIGKVPKMAKFILGNKQ